jgi:Ca2+-binding RTX toxin-like protein
MAVKRIVIDAGDSKDSITKWIQGIEDQPANVPATIKAGAGDDTIFVGLDSSRFDNEQTLVYGGDGNDSLTGNASRLDTLTFHGERGNDNIHVLGSVSRFLFFGGEGNDSTTPGSDDGHVDFHGGDGIDTYVNSSIQTTDYSLDDIANDGIDRLDNVHGDVEVLRLSGSIGKVVGNARANTIIIDEDEVVLDIDAGGGDDVIQLDNILSGANVLGGEGNDTISVKSAFTGLSIHGNAGNDSIVGGPKNDSLYGDDGNDTIDGGLGADLIDGGGWGADVVDYSNRTKDLYVNINDGKANDGIAGEGDFVKASNEIIYGGAGNDTLVGSDAANVLVGNAGNDRLFGGKGNDRLIGGTGLNTLYGEDGDDVLYARFASKDTLFGGAGFDRAQIDDKLDSTSSIEALIP